MSCGCEKEAEGLTGLQAGGISPLALSHKGFQVLIDASAQQFDEIQVFTSKSNFVPGEFYISKAIKFFTGMTYSRGWYP